MFSYFKGPHFNLLIWNYWLQKKLQDSINLLKQFENGTLPDGITDHKVGVWIFTVILQLPTLGISRRFVDKKNLDLHQVPLRPTLKADIKAVDAAAQNYIQVKILSGT